MCAASKLLDAGKSRPWRPAPTTVTDILARISIPGARPTSPFEQRQYAGTLVPQSGYAVRQKPIYMHGPIFITHATKDQRLAEALVDLLVNGIGVPAPQIFCSTVEGHTIPTGARIKEFLRDELTGGAAVIGLISRAYFESTWCVCELGATWALAKRFFPILVPPMRHGDLPQFLADDQSLLLGEDSHLDRLCDELPAVVSSATNIAKWNSKRKQLLASLPAIQAAPSATIVRTDDSSGRTSSGSGQRRLTIGSVCGNVELARTPDAVLSATGIAFRNDYIRRQNMLHNISVEFAFSHFDVETFRVQALLLSQPVRRGTEPSLVKTVSLRQGDSCNALFVASGSATPLMAADVTQYYTISAWPFDPHHERHLYEGEWNLKMELQCDSAEENLIKEYTLQVHPNGGLGISPKPQP